MTPVKNNGWRGYIIQTLTAILLLVAGAAGGLFSTIVWPAIQKNTEDIEAVDKRVTEQIYSTGVKLTRLEILSRADSVTLSEVEITQKEILRILGEIR